MAAKLHGAAAEFTARKYGGGMTENEANPSVGTSVEQVLRPDPERVFALVVNLSSNTVYLGYDSGVSASRGILLSANGGSYQVDVEEDLILPIRALWAISAGAGSSLYVVTMRRESVIAPEDI